MILLILTDTMGWQQCEIPDPEKALLMETNEYRLYLVERFIHKEPRAKPGPLTNYDKLFNYNEIIDENYKYVDTRFHRTSGVITEKSGTALLRIASQWVYNGPINTEAKVLEELWRKVIWRDRENFTREGFGLCPDSEATNFRASHFDWLIPCLQSTFLISEEAGERQANLMYFPDADVSNFYPLPKLISYATIDVKTSAWILGRFLKLLVLFENTNANVILDPVQTLICPDTHRLVYVGTTSVYIDSNPNPKAVAQRLNENIHKAAKVIRDWIDPAQIESERWYTDLLGQISTDSFKTAISAHQSFYERIRKYWPSEYYPFTYCVKASGEWRRNTKGFIVQD